MIYRDNQELYPSFIAEDLSRYFSPNRENHEWQSVIATGRNPRMVLLRLTSQADPSRDPPGRKRRARPRHSRTSPVEKLLTYRRALPLLEGGVC